MAKFKQGEPIRARVRNTVRVPVKSGGRDYKALVETLERLRGTMISTNVRTGDEEQLEIFSLLDKGTVRRKHALDGRLQWVESVLSDWIFNASGPKKCWAFNP